MTAKAVILVAGMGTRLQPRTLTTHKCLTRVNGTPILKNALDNLNDIGVEETVLVIGYLGDEIKKEIGADAKVVATGGLTSVILSETNDFIDHYDRALTLKGLQIIYELNK